MPSRKVSAVIKRIVHVYSLSRGGGLTTCFRFTAAIEDWADKFGVPVATLTYRTLVQGITYPAPVNDCEAAYNFLVEHAKELGISPNKIILHGNSSGGHLSLALSHRLKNAVSHLEAALYGCLLLMTVHFRSIVHRA